MGKQNKKYYTLGCCGIDCALCPRYYTEGKSKCPGCFGENFAEKHPPCSFVTCCVKNHDLEVCGECNDFPCEKYRNEKILKDSFVTHKKMMKNQESVQRNGIEKYIKEQNIRITILEKILSDYNDGKNKSYYCIATALLTIESLNQSLVETKNRMQTEKIPDNDYKSKTRILKSILEEYADKEHVELKLTVLT